MSDRRACGAQESGCFRETWDPRRPGRLVCKGCGAVYPGNPGYPDDRYLEIDSTDLRFSLPRLVAWNNDATAHGNRRPG